MATSSSRGPMTAIIVIVVAAAAAAGGYFAGQQGGGSSTGGAPTTMAGPAPAEKGVVVAKVDGSPIYQSQVDALIRDLGDRANQMPPAELQTRVLDHLIDNKLAVLKAQGDKYNQDPAVLDRLREAQANTLAESYIEHVARGRINDNVLKAKYDELVKQATPVEEVHARHILVKTEAEAKDIIAQLKKGADFEKLAKEKSTDPGSGASGGDLGYFTKDKMVPEFADAAFKLESGKVSDVPVHSQFGWHVIQVLDKRTQPLPTLDQVKPQLTNLVLQDEERKVMDDLHKSAKIERFNPDGTPVTDKPEAPAAAAPAAGAPAPAAATPAPAAAPAAPAAAPATPAPAAPAPKP